MKLGTLDIKKAYLGTFQLTHSNAFVQEEPLIDQTETNWLSFRCPTGSATIGLNKKSSNQTIEYSRDRITWTTMTTSTSIPLDSTNGYEVYFRGKLTGNNSTSNYTRFTMTGDNVYVLGDIMNLYNYENLGTTISYNYAFTRLFLDCKKLYHVGNILPATTLSSHCYDGMFWGCNFLTSAPELPATTLASGCYYNMFSECNNLASAPVLTAATLKQDCYAYMFNNCYLVDEITMLATNISASGCLTGWVSGVAASGTFYKDSGMSSLSTGTSGIPSGWTVLDYAG